MPFPFSKCYGIVATVAEPGAGVEAGGETGRWKVNVAVPAFAFDHGDDRRGFDALVYPVGKFRNGHPAILPSVTIPADMEGRRGNDIAASGFMIYPWRDY